MYKKIAVPVDLAHTDKLDKAINVAADMEFSWRIGQLQRGLPRFSDVQFTFRRNFSTPVGSDVGDRLYDWRHLLQIRWRNVLDRQNPTVTSIQEFLRANEGP